MKHVILTTMSFSDKELMKKYVKLAKEIFIPSLNSQTCKNFDLAVLCKPEDQEYLLRELNFKFIPILNKEHFHKIAIENNYTLQTRHDCDDYMSNNYVEKIQQVYASNIGKLDIFLIQSQPIQRMYKTGEVKKLRLYHDKRCSMHLTLCQRSPKKYNIYSKQHGQMYEITPNVISLGEGYTEWIIHGDNLTIQRRNFKKNN